MNDTYVLIGSTSNTLVQLGDIVCPGQEVIYECTICGDGATVWTGSLFDCTSGDITLRHSGFEGGLATGECNNGALIARSTRIITINSTSCFISQLKFSASLDLVIESNSTVECFHVDGKNETIVDTVPVVFTTGNVTYH